jgi:hypothetical protein
MKTSQTDRMAVASSSIYSSFAPSSTTARIMFRATSTGHEEITLPTTGRSLSASRQSLETWIGLEEDTISTKQLTTSIFPIIRRLSPTFGEDISTATPLLTDHQTTNKEDQAKMLVVKSGRSSNSNSQRTLPFCIHGDLFGRHPGASYHCRSDHRSRTPTPTATPHSERSRVSLRPTEEATGTRAPANSLKMRAADAIFDGKGED